MMRTLVAALAIGASLAAGAASREPEGPPPPPGTAAHGREIVARLGCGTCHAATFRQEAEDGLLRAGHPLEGAAYRGTWWNGRITTDAGDASDFCLKTFVDPNRAGFTAAERKALVLYMQALGSQRGISPLVLLRRDAGDVDLSEGNAERGHDVYARACTSCHEGGRETIRELFGDLSPAQVAGVIRKGSGTMPFFQIDRLTARQVADVAAYMEAVRTPSPPEHPLR